MCRPGEVRIDRDAAAVRHRRVMITGAGGSIGCRLARHAASEPGLTDGILCELDDAFRRDDETAAVALVSRIAGAGTGTG